MQETADIARKPRATAVSTETEQVQATDAAHGYSQMRALTGLLALAFLYTLAIGKSFFIPFTLSLLLSFLLAPAVVALEHGHIPRALGAGLLVLTLIVVLAAGVRAMVHPLEDWLERAPYVLSQLERKVYPLKKTVQEVSRTADQVDDIASVGGDAPQMATSDGPSIRDLFYANARALIMNLVVITFLLYFFLSWGRTVLLRISGLVDNRGRRRRMLMVSVALQQQVSKYLLSITLINIGLGTLVAGALYLLGMSNPLLWGAVAGLFNFLPYVGSVATLILLGSAALLTFDGLIQPGIVVAVFTGLTVLEGQVITPLILGRHLALNPLVIFLSVLFWFWIWGIMGALMAVPILVFLKTAGEHLSFFTPLSRVAGR